MELDFIIGLRKEFYGVRRLHKHLNEIHELEWSLEEVVDTYSRLKSFEEDWDAPGMDAYDLD